MAEHKYDGLLHTTLTDKEIRQKPWYKERVREKFLKSTSQQELGKVIVAGNWTFVKSGLDDCRTGVPSKQLNGDPLVRNESGVQPMLVGEGRRGRMQSLRGAQSKTSVRSDDLGYLPSDRASSTGSALDIKTAINRPLSDFEKRFSRKIPMQLRRLERVEAIEESIMQHKLSMFPHYEDSVPAEMFEEIMQILDPEVYASNKVESMRSQTAEREHNLEPVALDVPTLPSRSHTQTHTQTDELEKTQTQIQTQTQTQTELALGEDSDRPVNPYKWIAKRLEQEIRPRRKQDESFEKPEPTHTLPFTNEFCEWVKDIGGSDPSNNIKEQTLIGLFESGYETKPALSVPVQIVELSNIPPELRATAVQSAMQKESKDGAKSDGAPSQSQQKKPWRGGAAPPSEADEDAEFVKFRYGAWYLPTTLWKRMNADEPMRDPKEVQKEAMSEVKKRNLQIDTELAPMHCTKSFVDFAQKKGARAPQFLNSALDIQKQMEDEKNRRELQMVKEAKRRALHETLYGSAKASSSKLDVDDASTVAK